MGLTPTVMTRLDTTIDSTVVMLYHFSEMDTRCNDFYVVMCVVSGQSMQREREREEEGEMESEGKIDRGERIKMRE